MKEITLTRGKVALVDDEDYPELSKHKWRCNNRGYAIRSFGPRKQQQTVHMARVIMQAPADKFVDHKDGNQLNNQRFNLRLCTLSENQHNQRNFHQNTSSRYKGVHWNRARGKWHVQIGVNGKRLYLGLFSSEEAAALAYNEAAIKYHREFASLNQKLSQAG